MFRRDGSFEPGAVTEAILPASIQPAKLEDLDLPEGSRYSERLAVFVPVGIERVVGGFGSTGYVDGALNPLVATFDDAQADEVLYAGLSYTVEESQLWAGSHCRAVLLRET